MEHGARQDELLERLAAETAELGGIAIMQIAPEQGAFMTLLVRAIGARRALELGTFTGYSAICIARGLPDDGVLVSCDVNDEWAGIARRYFEQAGVAERIDLRLGPALDTLRAMPADEPFDFAFIDADKVGYLDYYEETLRLLRPGGLAMIDNMLRGGPGGRAGARRRGRQGRAGAQRADPSPTSAWRWRCWGSPTGSPWF